MFLSTFCAATSLLLGQAQPQAIKLNRVFTKGQKLQYEIKSTINAESRGKGLETWIPEDLDIQYKFTLQVMEMKPDGIADVKYLRPTVTEIEGETVDSPPKPTVEKTDEDLLLTVSPINDILKIKDLGKVKKESKPTAKKPPHKARSISRNLTLGGGQLGSILDQFVGEIYRLSLFLGPIDSSMDFAPKLPFDDVKPGDTWKRTAGYSPQKLKGKGEKVAVQRLDYLYTYQGVVDSQGKKVHRVTADLEVKTDLAEFVHQIYGVKSSETGIKEIPLQFKGRVEFDLDLKTMNTVRAVGSSTGGFKFVITAFPNEPLHEENIKGRTILKLLNP